MTFEEFATTRLRVLLGTATAICGDPVLAEDLVQDVLIKLHRHWARVSALDSPDGYVRRMLVNEYLSWRRKAARLLSTAWIGNVEPRSFASQPDHAVQHADREALRAEIARLPRTQQVVLALRYYGGLSDPEIAEAMGCQPVTVRAYASRALARLRVEAAANLIGTKGDVTS